MGKGVRVKIWVGTGVRVGVAIRVRVGVRIRIRIRRTEREVERKTKKGKKTQQRTKCFYSIQIEKNKRKLTSQKFFHWLKILRWLENFKQVGKNNQPKNFSSHDI